MEGLLTPTLALKVIEFGKEGGLALALLLTLLGYFLEVRRNAAKDKVIEAKDKINYDLQEKMLQLYGETKVAVSNCNLLLEMLTRGRR